MINLLNKTADFMKNDAERSRNYFRKQVWDPKCAKLDQNSDFGHVRTCQGHVLDSNPT